MWLKADRPHPRDYSTHRQTPPTDNDSSLLFAALGKAEVKRYSPESADWRTDRRTNGGTDGRYQVHYLPRFAVDKNQPVICLDLLKGICAPLYTSMSYFCAIWRIMHHFFFHISFIGRGVMRQQKWCIMRQMMHKFPGGHMKWCTKAHGEVQTDRQTAMHMSPQCNFHRWVQKLKVCLEAF